MRPPFGPLRVKRNGGACAAAAAAVTGWAAASSRPPRLVLTSPSPRMKKLSEPWPRLACSWSMTSVSGAPSSDVVGLLDVGRRHVAVGLHCVASLHGWGGTAILAARRREGQPPQGWSACSGNVG